MLRDLLHTPDAIAISPEQVIWVISESRFLDGAGTDGPGWLVNWGPDWWYRARRRRSMPPAIW